MTIGSLHGPRYGMLRCRCSPRPMLAAAFALGGVKIPGAAASCISNSLSTFADLPNNQRIRLRQSLVDSAERSQQRFNRPCEILTRGWFHIKRDGLGTASCPGWQPPASVSSEFAKASHGHPCHWLPQRKLASRNIGSDRCEQLRNVLRTRNTICEIASVGHLPDDCACLPPRWFWTKISSRTESILRTRGSRVA